MEINNSEFNAVKFDENAIGVMQTVAEALLNLTQVFVSQNIEMECMVKVEGVPLVDKETASPGTED